ncbi:MAG: hypothetical protein EU548_03505 [Promethearchaeota archaeon]|nr:MAG: hypothetical protein EU548_03505 [Candidatus Lokiarchaeota archaeon]
MVGNIEIEISGKNENPNLVNNQITELLNSSSEQINILSYKIDRFYTNELRKIAQKGIKVMIITSERGKIPDKYIEYYDQLKSTSEINIINNPNIKLLLAFNESEGIYCAGSLDREELEDSLLLITRIKEQSKLKILKKLFNALLPSFMRK